MFERVGNNKFIGWDESEDYFILAENTQDVSSAVTGLTMGTLQTFRAQIRAETLNVGSGNVITADDVKDEDNMNSNSATPIATKKYITTHTAGRA